MKISIVIPNYNGEKLIKKNLSKVVDCLSKSNEDYEIIVVDDGSTDGSIDYLKTKEDILGIKLIVNQKNLGFSSTVNKGVEETSGDIIVLLNTDVVPKEGFLKPVLPHFNDENVFAVGFLDESMEKNKKVFRGRGVGGFRKGFLVHRKGEIDKSNTLWASGGSSAFRKSVWDKLGGLNALYDPFYWEDIDLSYRALKSGYKIIFEKKSVVEHYHEEGSIKQKYSDSFIKAIAYRNQFIFVWVNITDLDFQFLHLIFLPYHFLKALIRGEGEFFVGFFRALILLPKIIQSSFRTQKLFVKTDREVLKEFSE
jgi:GT2 family glycosyltransferase